MPRIKHSAPAGGGKVSDIPYGVSWNGVTDVAPSKNAVYDWSLTIGYVAGNIAYQNPIGGNDATAVIGNRLKPYLTIGAAIAALGTSTSSALVIMGYNLLDDSNAPYGLKAPGSFYDIVAEPGTRVDYYGTYGAYISDATTFGSVYGLLDLRSYSATYSAAVNGVANWAVNIAVASTPKRIECSNIINENTSAGSNGIRIGACTGTAVVLEISGRILSRGGITWLMDTQSRVAVNSINLVQNTSVSSGMIKIVNPTDLQLNNLFNTQAYANYLGCMQPYVIQITDTTGNGNIKFENCNITAHETTDANYKVIEIITPLPSLPNLSFKRCDINSRFSTIYTRAGYSFYSATDISFKMRDTYVERNIGGAGVISNLISIGPGLMFEPNL